MVGILMAAVLAALTFALCTALGLPAVVGIVFALVVLVASVPTVGSRFGIRDLESKRSVRELRPPRSGSGVPASSVARVRRCQVPRGRRRWIWSENRSPLAS